MDIIGVIRGIFNIDKISLFSIKPDISSCLSIWVFPTYPDRFMVLLFMFCFSKTDLKRTMSIGRPIQYSQLYEQVSKYVQYTANG